MSRELSSDTLRIIKMQDPLQRRREIALKAARIGVFEFEPATQFAFWDDRVHELWGIADKEQIAYADVIGGVHPDDRAMHDAATEHALDPNGDGHLDMTYRVIPADGTPMRWVNAIADCHFEDGVPQLLVGTVQDVTAAQQQILHNEKLLHELEHRVKNTLATTLSILQLSLNDLHDLDSYFEAVSQRIRALAHSHDALRRSDWTAVDLETLIRNEAEAFLGADDTRFAIDCVPALLPPGNVLTFSMAIHELMTNAVKHGALSSGDGRVKVTGAIKDGVVHIKWHETLGDAAIPKPANLSGFGSVVLDQILPAETGGTVTRDMQADGMRCEITFPNLRMMPMAHETRVLLLEDQMLLAFDLKYTLEKSGFVVVGPFAGVPEAQAANDYDVALLDINLGGNKTSTPFADELLAANIPFAFLTGFNSALPLPSRFDRIKTLRKPASKKELIDTLSNLSGQPAA